MPFDWSLNPYTGCAHRCTFCYVRAFEARADRPSDDRYGRSIRVKVNVADVLRRELSRPSWKRESVAVGAATDPYQPAEGRYRLTRACIVELGRSRTPFSLITRGPMVRAGRRRARRRGPSREGARQLLGADARRAGLARDRARHRAAPPDASRPSVVLTEAGIDCGVALAPDPPRSLRRPGLLADVVREARAAGATGDLGERAVPPPRDARALSRGARARLARAARRATSGSTRAARTSPRPRRSPSARRCEPSPRSGRRPRRPTHSTRARARATRALVVVRARNHPFALVESPTWRRTGRSRF